MNGSNLGVNTTGTNIMSAVRSASFVIFVYFLEHNWLSLFYLK